jgi:hypothetical protein
MVAERYVYILDHHNFWASFSLVCSLSPTQTHTHTHGNAWAAMVGLVEAVVDRQQGNVSATTRNSRASDAFCFVRPGVI